MVDDPPVIVEGFDLTAFMLSRGWYHVYTFPGLGLTDLFNVGDGDLEFFAAHRDGVYVVENTERGSRRQGEGSFSDLGTTVRYLMVNLGQLQLSFERRKALVPEVPGVTVEKTPVSTRLEWSEGWAELLRDTYAELLARSIGHSLEELAASMAHPDGAPLFLK